MPCIFAAEDFTSFVRLASRADSTSCGIFFCGKFCCVLSLHFCSCSFGRVCSGFRFRVSRSTHTAATAVIIPSSSTAGYSRSSRPMTAEQYKSRVPKVMQYMVMPTHSSKHERTHKRRPILRRLFRTVSFCARMSFSFCA